MAVHTNPPVQELALPAPGLSLAATLQCGQTFSWRQTEEGVFTGTAANHCVQAALRGGTLVLRSSQGFTPHSEAYWTHYFALNEDYDDLKRRFCRHKTLAECVKAAPGIRLLRQPFFDTLLSFIISQNNHIPRIFGIVQRLRTGFGTQLPGGEFGFPTADGLAGLQVEDLAELRAGFRAKYLIDAARKVASGAVSEAALQTMDDDAARASLMQIQGVGPKVADCVLLYGLGRNSVVPMDVWMRRAMAQAFPKGMPKAAKGFEGIAQQYIFCWARENKLGQKPAGK